MAVGNNKNIIVEYIACRQLDLLVQFVAPDVQDCSPQPNMRMDQ
jgi:hypothetical protein